MSDPGKTPLAPLPINPSRRAVVFGAGFTTLAGLLGLLSPSLSAGAALANAGRPAPAPESFMALSRTVTGVAALDATLGARIYALLLERDPGLDAKINALTRNHDTAMADAALAATQASVLKAWYLGVVGSGKDARVVAYEHALMYAPLADVCVLPTFARGEPHYWAKPPFTSAGRSA